MNYQQTQKIFNALSRNEEITRLRAGTVLKAAGIQKREYYRILRVIQSFNNPKGK